jgi:hypothetical protein
MVDDMAVLAQALGDVVGGLLVVFDEKDFHLSPDIWLRPHLPPIQAKRNDPQLYKHSMKRPSGRHGPSPIFLLP